VFHIVLHEPEIPPNTGNVLRLAANAGMSLHLVRPLGFTLRDRELARAGLDYADLKAVSIHDDWASCLARFASHRVFAVTKRGARRYDAPTYRAGDVFVFGSETRGLPQSVLDPLPDAQHIRVPMRPGSRSLNLSNAVAVVIYEAWRQNDFARGE
jgi:tRNA (cytidine/uridine-2'-O-)-methyltransferase